MLKFVLSTVIFLILFSGCAGKAEQSSQIDPMETAPPSVTEPAEIQMVDSSKLPAGYEVLEEPDRLLITDNGKIIGAIETYPISNDMIFDPYYRWLETLGIPDFETEGLCRSGGSSLYGNWETHFESDVPPGVESSVSRYHTFYVGKTKVWDVWFDLMMIDRTTMDSLLKALTVY
jgi:hypothetical protein